MSGNGDDWDVYGMIKEGVDSDDALSAPPNKHAGVFLYQLRFVTMMRGEVEVARLQEVIADSAGYLGVVAVAQLRDQDSDGLRLTTAQGAGKEIRLVVQFAGSGFNPVA